MSIETLINAWACFEEYRKWPLQPIPDGNTDCLKLYVVDSEWKDVVK